MNAPAVSESAVLDALRQLIDPEIGCNVVDLGLIYNVVVDGGAVRVDMTLTTPGCPMHESLRLGAERALLNLDGVTEAEVVVVWDPPWHPGMMTAAGRSATRVPGVC
jgi:metal-sulfur cluster biosynthetic enzyme